MAYPAPSNWTNAEPYAAWFRDRRGQDRVCATEGWSFLNDVGYKVQSRLEEAGGTLQSFDGPIDAVSIAVNPDFGWEPLLLRGLYAVARLDRAPAAHLAAIERAARSAIGTVVPPQVVQTGVWVTYLNEGATQSGQARYGLGSPDDVQLPQGAVLPTLREAIPAPTGSAPSGLQCRVQPRLPGEAPPSGVATQEPFKAWPVLLVGGVVFGGLLLLSRATPVRRK